MFNFQPQVNSEEYFNLREHQTYESSKLYGRPVWYLRSSIIKDNKIFGEAISRDFLSSNAYQFYATRDEDTQFAGTEAFGGFGFIPSYNSIIFIPVKWFKLNSFEPIEGDLIYYEVDRTLFEITKVGTKTEAYEGDIINDRLFNYRIYLKLYSLADDDFDVAEIPSIEDLDLPSINNQNDSLSNDIVTEDVVIPSDPNNPFGDLG